MEWNFPWDFDCTPLPVSNESIVRFSGEQASGFLRALNLQAARTLKFAGIEAVHDLRVAVRRFRQILKVLKPWLPEEESRLLRRELKELMARAGEVRDRDIALHLLRAIDVPKNRRIVSEFHDARTACAHSLHQSLHDFQLRDTGAAWRRALKLVRPAKAPAASEVARDVLPDMLKDHLRRGHLAARKDTPEKKLHRFRIATKEVRYTLDLFTPLYGDGVGDLGEKLKKLQTHLGSIHDCIIARDLVKDAQSPAGKKEIVREIQKRRDKKTERFLRDYRRNFEDQEALRQWTKALRHP
jgi:CHAD domain-containing protein